MGVGAERDTILWGKDEEEAWPENGDPEQGFFVNKQAETEPYSALYVHLVVQIMYGWVHLNKILHENLPSQFTPDCSFRQ